VQEQEPQTLELRDYLRVVRRRKWVIVVTMVVCIAAAVTMSLIQAPVYSSTARLLLDHRLVDKLFVPNGESNNNTNTRDDTERGNEIQVMYSPKVRLAAQKTLGRAAGPVDFAFQEGSDVVSITATDSNPKRAAKTANVFTKTYMKIHAKLIVQELNQAAAEVQNKINTLNYQIAQLQASLAASPAAPVAKGEGPSDQREIDRDRFAGQRISYSAQLDQLQTGAAVAAQSGGEILAEAGPASSPDNRDPLRNGLAGVAIGLVLGFALAFLRDRKSVV